MNDYVFMVFIAALSLCLVIVVGMIAGEAISHHRDQDLRRYKPPLKYLRSYRDGYTFSDREDLSQAIQVLYITSDFIEFSDTGINGRFDRIWER